ncbi:MAG: hypothetical protein A2921_00590 [Candidatus Magasanikbacteria bacterium RIFCSPLOWO2_01_FULL_43_20b]|uniref:HAD family phosphatase n=1 Tax=Candidatus Magasanikbacteria bacterium RIFCSPLOWO2_12_FULL_43_12 TaxID=1798692 RepID=A0A1F6MVG2_9BACT|nr:MAG: hypothetical protein A3I93_02445 [Candidatus Magasanikbacteria bacterium RIFCSPLOWO2_02_FULL_43_22]OGH72911.1 MAG: hypothetical protein A2921_00590 [Candidatus Magasanikbacteria bacterium RIFCSPLOWO2_01_FULL_43_20b]OGH75657.1 MAG: hypothetical protein A3G00_04160 [Candidatus Magasanikbacteria bacterium RIFCSPLOWO2_12_FULL_43_12]
MVARGCFLGKEFKEKCVGRKTTEGFVIILKENGIEADESLAVKLQVEKDGIYKKIIKKKLKSVFRKKITDIILQLVERKKVLAVATSGSREEVEIILGKDGLDLKKNFSYIVTGEDVKKGKPHPEIYRKVAKIARVKLNKCLVFEDTGVGVVSAFRAGMNVVAVPSEFTKGQD